jgi:hypothetical protein
MQEVQVPKNHTREEIMLGSSSKGTGMHLHLNKVEILKLFLKGYTQVGDFLQLKENTMTQLMQHMRTLST